jgi:predicted phosphoadenosine phosphosulfate sulfurtransferase
MNVWEATQERLKVIFEEFDNIYVSFSGGKDSGVLLNLTIDYARKYYPGRKIGVFHIDYEAQYQATTDYVDEVFSKDLDVIKPYRICLPLSVPCCTSMTQDHWSPWDADMRDLWVRKIPESINESNHTFDWFAKGMWDYDFQDKFIEWNHKTNKAKKTCCLVGIRTQESFNRWRAIHSDKNYNKFQGHEWTKMMNNESMYNAYPIYDWVVEDVWTANGKQGWTYNNLYNIFYQAGVPLGKQRVASPFISAGIESLKLYKVVDPKTWGKLIGRVNGVNFSGLYGGTTAMGWKNIKLPPGHTWKSYMEFLLSTLPDSAREGYKKKLDTSKSFWRNRGGCLSQEVIDKLRFNGVAIEVKEETNYATTKKPVTLEYLDDIDITEFNEIPTYKRMCVCIMKNDHLCKFMGFSLTKTEQEIRSRAEQKYKEVL